ncbi:MAG: peptidoglycan-associated lipoprotein [Rhodospirillaceae bacterium]|nr:MAG: peptidoglycan-associated lipoprotein [Rhodospirillaceae bacterium]
MKLRLLSVFAAVALVAACESTTEGTASTAGAGSMGGLNSGIAAVTTPSVALQQEFEQAVGQDRVFFDFDKYAVRSNAKPVLMRWADWMKHHPQYPVTLEGHADERGTREYNLALGEKRANAVKEFLAAHGVSSGQLTTISYGKERPAVPGSNEAAWSQNRRAVATVGGGTAS